MLSVRPVVVTNFFPLERRALLNLLKALNDEQWNSDTICRGWTVKDIVQHLLKDDIGILSRKRDGYRTPNTTAKEFKSQREFVEYINFKNQEWVTASKSFSPRLLIEFLELTDRLTYCFWKTVDQNKVEAQVSWVSSNEKLPNWVDIAREYTERWLHQSHIREAVGSPLLYERKLFNPFIRAYMLALPLTYKSVNSDAGNIIKIIIEGEAGGTWSLLKDKGDWTLYDKSLKNKAATKIFINQEKVWRLFSKGIDKEEARESVKIQGNEELGDYFFNTVSLIA